jgi:hypothetical protein
MSCKIPAGLTNGVESNIKKVLLEVYNGDENKAEESYSYFRTPKFLEIFGNYSDALQNQEIPGDMVSRLDEETFEPKLFYHERLNKYYFIDKDNEKVFYPYEAQGLKAFLYTNEIKEFAKSLAYNYYKQHLNFNLETLTFEPLTNVSLTEFIEDFTEEVGNNLSYGEDSSVDQIYLGSSLLDTVDHKLTNEWVREVKQVFSSFKLDIKEEEVEDEEHIRDREDQTADELVRKESFLKDSKDNVNNNIKLYLSLLEREKTNMFGLKKFVEFGDIYTSLNKTLANLVSTNVSTQPESLFEEYKEKIGLLAETKPYFKGLYDIMNQPDVTELFRNQIVSAFRLNFNNFLGSEVTKGDNDLIGYAVKNLSNASSRRSTLLKQWQSSFLQKHKDEEGNIFNPKGKIQINYDNFSAIRNNINAIEDLFEGSKEDPSIMDRIIEDLATVGITLNSEGKLSIRDLDRQEDVYRGILLFLDDLTPGESSFEDKLDQIEALYSAMLRGLDRIGTTGNIFTDQGIFTKLADAEAFFQEEGSDASIYTVGKTKWAYSYPSYLSERINSWKKHPELMFRHYQDTSFNQGSDFMQYFLAIDKVSNPETILEEEWRENYYDLAKDRISKIELAMFNSVQERGRAGEAKDTKEIKGYDSTIDYLNKLLGFRIGAKMYHKSALAADKSTEYQIHYDNALFKESGVTGKDEHTGLYDINDSILDILFKYFESEYKRMAEVYDEIEADDKPKLIKNYHTGGRNGLKSQLFPSFSVQIDKDTKKVTLPNHSVLAKLYDRKTGKAHLASLDKYKEDIKQEIKHLLSNNIEQVFNEFVENEIFKTNEHGELTNVGLDSKVFDFYKKNTATSHNAVQAIVADMLVNSIVSQVEYSKMFTGDTAYYKNMIDYKKRVPASYTDGLYLNLESADDVYFNTAIVSSVEHPAFNMDKLKELLGEDSPILKYYENINAADAQAWITPKRWEFIRKKLGKWRIGLDDVIMTKMESPNAKFSPEELKRLAQPLKGVYFDIVDGAPRYLKYSQAVLVPRLVKGTDLARLKEAMDKYEIDELITEDGFKVGAQGITTIHNADGTLADNIVLNKVPLTNAAWKLQQDLSPKGFKSTELGSQIMKIIFQGLSRNLDKEFYVGDKVMTGRELVSYIHDIISEKSDRGLATVFRRLGIDPETYKIQNEDRMYAAMIEDLSKRRDTPDNLLNALLAGTAPIGIAGQEQIFQNVFSSAINKAAVKIRTNGGSFIQMADFGISKEKATEADSGIRFTPWFNEPDGRLHTPEVTTNKDGVKVVKPGGVFISGSFIAKYVPNYKELSDVELFGKLDKDGKYKGGLIDDRILKTIIGYRIPNQGLPSNDSFTVMGILPEDVADTIVAYTGITTKTGSDFDIDKMYIMMPSYYTETNIKSEAFDYVWQQFKGRTRSETIENLLALNMDITDSPYTEEEIHEKMSIPEGRKELTKTLHSRAVDVILSSENKNSPVIRKIKKKLNPKVTRLRYATAKADTPLHTQSDEALNNQLIEAYSAVLTSMHAIKDIMKPIDEPLFENDIKNIYPEEVRKDMMDFDAYSDIALKQEFKLGKAGLGQNVNALTDSVFGSMANLGLSEVLIPRGNVNSAGTVAFDRESSVPLTKKEMEEYIESHNKFDPANPVSMEDIMEYKSVKIDDAMKSLINGFVDIAKDPFITRGGWNTLTNNVGLMLIRAGVHPFFINSFMAQPILKEYSKFVDNNESSIMDNTDNLLEQFLLKITGEEYAKRPTKEKLTIGEVTYRTENFFREAVPVKNLEDATKILKGKKPTAAKVRKVKSILRKDIEKSIREKFNLSRFGVLPAEAITLVEDMSEAIYNNIYAIAQPVSALDLSLTELRDQIKKPQPEIQINVLANFRQYIPLSKILNKSNRSSKVTTDGKGKNVGSLLVMHNHWRDILLEELEGKPGALTGFISKLTWEKRPTFLTTMYKNAIVEPFKIMKANPKYFLSASDEAVSTFNYIAHRVYGGSLKSQEIADILEKEYQSYVMSGFAPLKLSKDEKVELFDSLPKQLTEMKEDPRYKDNALIQSLYVNQGTDRQYIAMPNNKKPVSFKNTLTDSWRGMLEDDSTSKFAEELIKYSYAISGFNMSMNQFHDFIPYEWFNKNRFNSYLKHIQPADGMIDFTFVDQFFRHHVSSSRFAKNVDPRHIGAVEGYYSSTAVSMININLPQIIKTKEKLSDEEAMMNPDYVPQDRYYSLVGIKEVEDLEGSALKEGIYVRTTPLGGMDKEGNKVVEYDINAKIEGYTAESILHEMPELEDLELARYDLAGIKSMDEAQVIDELISSGTSTIDILEFYDKLYGSDYSSPLDESGCN